MHAYITGNGKKPMGHVLPVEHNTVIGTCQNDFLVPHNMVAELNSSPNSAIAMMRVSVE